MLAKQSTVIFNILRSCFRPANSSMSTRRGGRISRGVDPREGLALNMEKVQGRVVREVTPRVNSRYISDKSGVLFDSPQMPDC